MANAIVVFIVDNSGVSSEIHTILYDINCRGNRHVFQSESTASEERRTVIEEKHICFTCWNHQWFNTIMKETKQ